MWLGFLNFGVFLYKSSLKIKICVLVILILMCYSVNVFI